MDAGKEPKLFNKCALPQCRALRFSLFHKFPQNQIRLKEWLNAFNSPVLNSIPYLRLRGLSVCSRHFRVEDYLYPTSRRLNSTAVPTLNLETLNELDKCRHAKTQKGVEYVQSNSDETSNDSKSADDNMNVSLKSEIKSHKDEELLNDNTVSSSGDVNDTIILSPCVEGSTNVFQIMVDNGFVLMKVPQMQVRADILWLRHICSCQNCLKKRQSISFINFFELYDDLQPVMATVEEETKRLDIIWSDGHTSTFNLNELYEKLQQKQQSTPESTFLLWNFQHIQYCNDLQPINFNDLLQSNITSSYKALYRLQKSGVLIINQIPKDDKDGFLKKSIINKLFEYSWDKFTIEKRKFLPKSQHTTPFSNCTFNSMDKGLQILTLPYDKDHLRIQLNLVDGFWALQQLPEDTYAFLTQFQVEYNFKDDKGYNYLTKQPVILKEDEVNRIWFDPLHMDSIKSQDFRRVGKHFKILNDVLQMQQNQWPVELNTETIVIMDNYRICWGLKESLSECELDCFYMERKHYLSSLNILKNNMSG